MRFEDFKHLGWAAFVHPVDFPETVKAYDHAIQTGTSYEGVMRLRRADGEFRWHHARCEPLRDRQGRIIQWYGLSVDIDERKNAEDLLRRSEARLAEAQRLTHIGVAAYNETAILYGSEETYRIWGFDPAQGVPSREAVFRRIHPDDRDRLDAEVQRALGEKRRYSIGYRIVLPDGTVKHVESIGEPAFSATGELIEIVATQIDVTERKRAEEEHERLRQLESDLAHMNRLSMMGELAASLAHEITQPIAAARNNARAALNFLDKQPSDLGEVREALGCVVGDADRAGVIIDRMRDHIKKAPPRKHRFDLNEAINEVIVLARSAIAENRVSVQTRLSEGLAPVEGDRVQLQQVILNLVLNAAEAMSAVDEGRVSCRSAPGKAEQMAFSSRCAILGRALIRNISSAFSMLSTPRSPAVWGWGCQSAGPSSMPMAAGSGQTQMSLEAPHFSSPCPARKEAHEFSLDDSPEWRAARRHRQGEGMRGNQPPTGKPRQRSPMTSSAVSWTRERTDHPQRPRPRTLSAYGLRHFARMRHAGGPKRRRESCSCARECSWNNANAP